MKRRHSVEEGETASLAQRVQDLIHARDGKLAKAANVLELLELNSDLNTSPDFFGTTTKGLEYGKVECCIRPAVKY